MIQKVNKKIDNDSLALMHHSTLKMNTPVKVINPENEKFVITKITKTAMYPKIFNIVVSNKIAETLELDRSKSLCRSIRT